MTTRGVAFGQAAIGEVLKRHTVWKNSSANHWKPLNISPLRNGTLHSFSVLLSDYSFWTNSADILCCDCLDSLRLRLSENIPDPSFWHFFFLQYIGISVVWIQCQTKFLPTNISTTGECVHRLPFMTVFWASWQICHSSWTSFLIIAYLVFCGKFYIVTANFADLSSRM